VTIVLLALLGGALIYSLLAIAASVRYLSVPPPALSSAEPISILKPLAGLDLDLEANLRTFFEQDYPSFEILFAVKGQADPAVEVVGRLQKQFPHISSQLLITGEPPYANSKVFSLDRMMAVARNDLLVMSDSDVRVTPDLLRTVAAEFQAARLGVATCPYRAVAGPSFWSRLESIGMKDYLAEDFVMGKFAAETGHGVILSSYVIEHHIGRSDWSENAAHRLRWTRSTRRSRPLGYIGQLFTMPVPLALLVCVARPAYWTVVPLALLIRGLAAYVVSSQVLKAKLNWLLLPIEDLAGFAFWIAGFFGNTITWRGRRYRLQADGRFQLISS